MFFYMSWTKQLPSESGFYWYRNLELSTEMWIVEFDAEEKIITWSGVEIGAGGWWSTPIEGRFWNEKIQPPPST